MAKSCCLILVVGIGMVGSGVEAQSIFSPRAIALGAYSASVNDSRGFVSNPAGLVNMRDWAANTATYVPTSVSGSNFVFYGFALGKRFLENNAAAVQYAPGALLEFVVPSTETINGQTLAVDKKISYSEPFAFGIAHRFSEQVSVGLTGRLRTETVNNPQYQLQKQDSVYAIVSVANESQVNTWFFDLGLTWKPNAGLTLAAVGRSLVNVKSGTLPEEFTLYKLPATRSAVLGAAYDISGKVRLVAEMSTEKKGALGYEWLPGYDVSLRSGLYVDVAGSSLFSAVGIGAGWSYEFVELEASYMHFFRQDKRGGSTQVSDFDASAIANVDMNPYTSDRISLSVKAILGNVRESLTRIETVEMFGGVYPSAYQAFAYRPLGKVRVKNVSQKAVQAKASFYIDHLMDAPTESAPMYISPGETAEIPLTAVFNEKMKSVATMTIRDGNVAVLARQADEVDDKVQTRVLIHGRNDWDGDVLSLRYFVTPDDPEIIRYSREILLQNKDSLVGVSRDMEAFLKAKILFNAFAGKLLYVNAPKQSGDYVQYPSETLHLRGGDCDDMTVCFSSLLNGIGVSTAFVEVVPPGNPEKGHIYMLFDTGVDPKFGASITENPKRYLVRKRKTGGESIWIPIETTVITRGFEEAWSTGAQEHFDDVEVGLGIIRGWVKIVDVY